jgi:hypothetical protein
MLLRSEHLNVGGNRKEDWLPSLKKPQEDLVEGIRKKVKLSL